MTDCSTGRALSQPGVALVGLHDEEQVYRISCLKSAEGFHGPRPKSQPFCRDEYGDCAGAPVVDQDHSNEQRATDQRPVKLSAAGEP